MFKKKNLIFHAAIKKKAFKLTYNPPLSPREKKSWVWFKILTSQFKQYINEQNSTFDVDMTNQTNEPLVSFTIIRF